MSNAATPPPPSPQPEPPLTRAQQAMQLLGDLGAGLSLGALLGLILGMSVSPVAGTVVGGLVALLASFLGLRPTAAKADEKAPDAALTPLGRLSNSRMVGFGLGTVLALLGGLYMRTHGVLSPSPRTVAARWVEAQFSPEQARVLATYELLGTYPSELRKAAAPAPTMSGEAQGEGASVADKGSGEKKDEKDKGGSGQVIHTGGNPHSTVLFANEVDACNHLSMKFKDGPAAVKAWKSYLGGWAIVAAQVEKIHDPADQMQALETIRSLLCSEL